jgi:hypothetical protein
LSIGESESCGGSGAWSYSAVEEGCLHSRWLGGEWSPRSVVANMLIRSRDCEESRGLRWCRPNADIIERYLPIRTAMPTTLPLLQVFYTNHCRIAKAEL